jgi:hypothetical protein
MKPEVARASAVTHFVEEMLRLIRREFFVQHTDKRFFQERSMLIQAITFPAHWMNDRGVRLPASGYRRILGTVIGTIKRHGNRAKIQRFSVYFLHSVQEHMKHHGDEYYAAAKAARPISAVLPAVTRQVRLGKVENQAERFYENGVTTAALSKIYTLLRSRGGRRKRPIQPDLLPAFPPLSGGK